LYPDLAGALSTWARESLLTFNGGPVGWAMDTALETLRMWRTSDRRFVPVDWEHAMPLLETYPAGSPEYFNAAGKSESDVLAQALTVSIPYWDRPNGETLPQFKRRSRRNLRDYTRRLSEWTERPEFESYHHVAGLAYWQAGWDLADIRSKFASAFKLHIGSGGATGSPALRGARADDLSVISKGLKTAARFIEIDQRPARRSHI
jgi:hypothetical protein